MPTPKNVLPRRSARQRYRHVVTGIAFVAFCLLALWFLWLTGTYLPRADLTMTEITLPDLIGQPYEAVVPTLREEWYDVSVEYAADENSAPGTVLSQFPEPGDIRRIRPGESRCRLSLTVSTGQATYTLPDLTGRDAREAADLLHRAGIGTVREGITRRDLSPGQVVGTRPESGSILHPGECVTILESRMPAVRTLVVPDVTGKEASAANLQLLLRGLKPAGTVYVASDRPAGTVLSQRPVSGAMVTSGSPVYLTVSDGQGVPPESDSPMPSAEDSEPENPVSTPEGWE